MTKDILHERAALLLGALTLSGVIPCLVASALLALGDAGFALSLAALAAAGAHAWRRLGRELAEAAGE